MSIKEKVLAVLSAVGGFILALFGASVVAKGKDAKLKKLENETEALKQQAAQLDIYAQTVEKTNEVKKENEQKIKKTAGDNLDSFNSCIDILSK